MDRVIQLHFKGPVDVTNVFNIDVSRPAVSHKKLGEDFVIRRNTPGFYVWGHSNRGVFIPYYVGKTHSCILSRIKSHITDIIKEESCYTRLTENYLKGLGCTPFYADELFQKDHKEPDLKALPAWLRDNIDYFKDKIFYLNNQKFFQLFKGMGDPKRDKYGRNFPISNLTMDRSRDDSLVANLAKMQFAFAEFSSEETGKELNDLFETLESHIKYRLKGKTFGSVYTFETMIKKLAARGIRDVTLNCDPPLGHLFKDVASNQGYPGYFPR